MDRSKAPTAGYGDAKLTVVNRPSVEALSVVALSAVAVLLRVAWSVAQLPTQITWDGAEYARAAQNLHDGLGFVGMRGTFLTGFPPLYSITIAAASFAFPSAEIAGKAVSIVAGAAFVPLAYGCARLLAGARAAVFAGLIAALLPFAVDISTLVLSDALFMMLAAAGLYFALRYVDAIRWSDAALSGLLFGLAYLTRPEGLLLGLAVMASLAVGVVLFKRRSATAGVTLGVIALLTTALPYSALLSARSGHFQLEGKSAINFAIARRMQAGQSYTVAADAIDDRLQELGPEIDAAYTAPPGTHLNLLDMIRLALGNTAHHALEIPRTLISRVFGTPLLPLAAAFGFLHGPWTRRRFSFEVVIVAYCVAQLMALSTVYQFWDRYADNFIIVLAIWGGAGIDYACTTAERGRRFNLAWPATVLTSVLFLTILIDMQGYFRTVNESRWLSERVTGEELRRIAPRPGPIASVSDQPVYYAGGTWIMLPWAPNAETALAYLRTKKPAYVILNRPDAAERSYVADWLDRGIPDRHAHVLYVSEQFGHHDAAIYRWGLLGDTEQAQGPPTGRERRNAITLRHERERLRSRPLGPRNRVERRVRCRRAASRSANGGCDGSTRAVDPAARTQAT